MRGVAELGVVLLLFIVGLELKVSRLLSMRRDIIGLGLAQLIATGVVIAAVASLLGLSSRGAIVTGAALALSATAIALQILQERGDLHAAYGTRTFAVLLFQDLAIVPMLALTPLLASAEVFAGDSLIEPLLAAGKAIAAIVAVVLVGRFLLNPVFRALGHERRPRGYDRGRACSSCSAPRSSWTGSASPWPWAPSWPACCSPNRTSAISSKPTSSRSAACCSASSS